MHVDHKGVLLSLNFRESIVHQHCHSHLDINMRHERLSEDEDGKDDSASLRLRVFIGSNAVIVEFQNQVWPEKHVFLQQYLLENEHFAEVGVLGELSLV